AFIPEAYGGGGIDSALTHVVVNEELNWGCAGMATGLIGAGLAYLPIIHMGTEEQKKRFLTRFTGKEARLGALCLTEPDAGSDVANISTTAKKDGDEWVLNGVKRFITNGGIADIHVVFATLDKSRAHFGIRAFVVEHGTPGLKAGKVEDKMGVRASHTAEVILDDCRIPEDNLLGSDEGTAFYGAMKTLESSRPLVASGAVGIARAAYEYALDYSRKRKAFGTPIAKKQAIAFMLADMKTKIEAARLLTWRAAWMLDHGLPMNKEASIAKLFAADVQVFGELFVRHRQKLREVADVLLHEQVYVLEGCDCLGPLLFRAHRLHPLLEFDDPRHDLGIRPHAQPDLRQGL